MTRREKLLVWSIGFLFSFLFIWAVSVFFVNSVAPKKFDPLLEKFVFVKGTTTFWCSEGWAETHIGKHGLTELGELALEAPGPKIIFWGDSQVEALQIDDSKRTINLFNKMMAGKIHGFAVGAGGRNIVDYFFDIPRYAKLTKSIVGHVILLTNFDDIIPGRHVAGHGEFANNPYSFVESKSTVSKKALKYWPILNRLRLEFLYFGIYDKLRKYDLHFCSATQKIKHTNKQNLPSSDKLEDAWTFLLKSLNSQANCPLVFVYAPSTPRLSGGKIHINDNNAHLNKLFKQTCAKEGVGYIDLISSFNGLYEQEHVFPRGFFNSVPSCGHLNEYGHELIAQALYDYFSGAEK